MDRVDTQPTTAMLRIWRREILSALRKEGRRVLRHIRDESPQRTGNLRRRLKFRTGWDGAGPYARIVTTATRRSYDPDTGRVTTFRYGLAIQQQDDYLGRGLRKTPRR